MNPDFKRYLVLIYTYFHVYSPTDVNIPDKLGHTPLHVAVQKCQPQCIRYLLENGANPNISDNTQTPPLILAVELGCTQCLEVISNYKLHVHCIFYVKQIREEIVR